MRVLASILAATSVVSLVTALGCTQSPENGPSIDGGRIDTGTPLDSGQVAKDAGAAEDAAGAEDSAIADTGQQPEDAGTPVPDGGQPPSSGAFTLLTYNVAGLPQALSGGNPIVNTPLMSPLLNLYDIVLVQEDFAYHEELALDAVHPYQTSYVDPPGVNMGDGLNRFSDVEFADHMRTEWEDCNGVVNAGSDCLSKKGFAVARHELAPGVFVDIYNLHMDAGRSMDDYDTRVLQIAQLEAAMAAHSGDSAVIVAGDTNLKEDDEVALLDMIAGSNLTDSCRLLACPDPGLHDRIFFRNSDELELTPSNWRADPAFVDADGEDLSDHEAIGVDFSWTQP